LGLKLVLFLKIYINFKLDQEFYLNINLYFSAN